MNLKKMLFNIGVVSTIFTASVFAQNTAMGSDTETNAVSGSDSGISLSASALEESTVESSNSSQNSSSVNATAPNPAKMVDAKIKVMQLKGMIQFKSFTDAQWKTLQNGVFITDKVNLRTGPNSQVQFAFRDGTQFTVKENSNVVLMDLKTDGTNVIRKIRVISGFIEYNAVPISSNSIFTFDLLSSKASIKGTDGGFSVNKGVVGAYLNTGAVDYLKAGGQKTAIKPNQVLFQSSTGKIALSPSSKPQALFSDVNQQIKADNTGDVIAKLNHDPQSFLDEKANVYDPKPTEAAPAEPQAEAKSDSNTAPAAEATTAAVGATASLAANKDLSKPNSVAPTSPAQQTGTTAPASASTDSAKPAPVAPATESTAPVATPADAKDSEEKPAEEAPAEPEKSASVEKADGIDLSDKSKEDEKGEAGSQDKDKDGGKDKEFKFTPGISIGYMSIEGLSMTRIAFQPEFSIGRFGMALDLELFIDSKGKFTSYGWEFEDFRSGLNSILRKIYYIRWNHPGDKFYVRLGSIDGVSLTSAQLITSGFGNVALYPGSKPIGAHLQLNDISPMKFSIDIFASSFEELFYNKTSVVGGQFSFAPLGFTPVPVLNGLKFGISAVSDLDQLGAIADTDKDGCPNKLDDAPKNKDVCISADNILDRTDADKILSDLENGDDAAIAQEIQRAKDQAESVERQLKDRFDTEDVFTMVGLDYEMPIINSKLLALGIYGGMAKPFCTDSKEECRNVYGDSWGMVPLGASMKVSIFKIGAEYRWFSGKFQPGYFNSLYDAERVIFNGVDYITKEQSSWISAPDYGERKGVYGSLDIDLGGWLDVGGSYSYLWTNKAGAKDDQSYAARAALGSKFVDLIPKLANVSFQYEKNLVGYYGDDFFERTVYTTYGYNVSFEIGGNMQLSMDQTTYFVHDVVTGKLIPERNFGIETKFTF